ncbi:MAG: helix-turn-helix domain-containing protein [Paracoccaceae bacterium]
MRTPCTDQFRTNFGRRLKALRKAAAMDPVQLADEVGHDVTTIRELESGEKFVSAVELWDFCAAFDRKPHEFFEEA